MSEDHVHDLIPAYALYTLTPSETAEVERHLAECTACERELRAMLEVTAELAVASPQVDPPAALRSALLESIGAPAPRAVRPAMLSPSWAFGLAAATVVVVVILGVLTLSLNQRLSALQARLAAQEEVLALLAAPTAKTTTLTGQVEANVRFVYDPQRGRGALVVADLRDPGQEFVYQLWLVARGGPESAGVFRPVTGRPIIIPVTADFNRYQAVAISVEQAPSGAAQPTKQPILVGTI